MQRLLKSDYFINLSVFFVFDAIIRLSELVSLLSNQMMTCGQRTSNAVVQAYWVRKPEALFPISPT